MDILRKEWNGIEYYLVDIYKTEFKFGIVYHFVSDNDEKFCLYKDNNYIPIKNKNQLKKIDKELKINTDILFRNNKKQLGNVKEQATFSDKERLSSEEEYQIYDEVSKIIHELHPDIPYKDTMEILNDNSGIYYVPLEEDDGQYYHETKEIYLDKKIKDSETKKRVRLHEAIHKLTDRKGFLKQYNREFVGLIEGATEKICEDKYGDKTSHTEELDNKAIQVNFSCDATYMLPQIVYRQMAYLVEPKMADKSIINGDRKFFDKFSDLYGKDLFLYLNHRAKRFLSKKKRFEKESSFEKRQLKYLKEAQSMTLRTAFDRKFLDIQTQEDIINYMTELRNFEYTIARIEDDTTFQDYYNSKYNDIIQLAKQKGMDLSKIEQFQYSEVDFYPERNEEKISEIERTKKHIYNLCEIEKIDLSKCIRMQVEPSPNFFDLDIILQNGIPVSAVENGFFGNITNIEQEEEMFDKIKKDFGIKEDEIDIYNIALDTYMIIKPGGTSEIYSTTYNKIYSLTKNEIDLGITPQDIEKEKLNLDTTTQVYEQETIYMEKIIDSGNKRNIMSLFNSIKDFFVNRKLRLPEPTAKPSVDISNRKTKQESFRDKLNPNNPIYDHSTKVPVKKAEKSIERSQEK